MAVWLHITLLTASCVAGILVASPVYDIVAAATGLDQLQYAWVEWMPLLSIVVCVMLPWMIFKKVIHAKCSSCGGKTYLATRNQAATYRCTECENVQRTAVWFGSNPNH